jgi:hypothetical protein
MTIDPWSLASKEIKTGTKCCYADLLGHSKALLDNIL